MIFAEPQLGQVPIEMVAAKQARVEKVSVGLGDGLAGGDVEPRADRCRAWRYPWKAPPLLPRCYRVALNPTLRVLLPGCPAAS